MKNPLKRPVLDPSQSDSGSTLSTSLGTGSSCLGPLRRCLGLWLIAVNTLGCSVVPAAEVNEQYLDVLFQRHTNYRIKEGDVITVEISNFPEDKALNQLELLVLSDGRSDFFTLSNEVFVGKTIVEVEERIKEGAAPRVEVSDLDIRVQIAPAEERIYLVGQFDKPAQLPLTVRMTLQEAIAAVGGTRVTGDTDWARLERPYRNPIEPDVFRIDLSVVETDIYLLPGDRIVLGRNSGAAIVNYLREFLFGVIPNPVWAAAAF